LLFAVEAFDGQRKIGEGRRRRGAVSLDRFRERYAKARTPRRSRERRKVALYSRPLANYKASALLRREGRGALEEFRQSVKD
jgi:hypothetical protein